MNANIKRTTTNVKRTYVSPDKSIEQRERAGFVSVECYGDIVPERNELGAIAKNPRNYRVKHGIWLNDAEFVERIFLVEPA